VANNEEPKGPSAFPTGPKLADHAVSALNAWVGDYLADTGNGLALPLEWVRDNAGIRPSDLVAPSSRRVVVVVHGLGCNEGCFRFPTQPEHDYGTLLARDRGFLPLYLRYNSGRRVSQNGADLARLLDATWETIGDNVDELVLIGHSMGGLVLRSACHHGASAPWTQAVRHVFYLGSPHLGAPLEKFANVTTHVLGKIPTTATRVIRDVINTRSSGVKDLRYGNLTDADWLNLDPDALLENKRVTVPWLHTAQHHRVVGHALAKLPFVGDGMVLPTSAAAATEGHQPPGEMDVTVMVGVPHLTLAHHPRVYELILGHL
jgi:triacylglycerol lipase